MKYIIYLTLFATLFFFACSGNSKENKNDELAAFSQQRFPNVLNIKNLPDSSVNWDAFCFSDKGAWFGFALPPDNDLNYNASFVGPFLMTNGKWLSNSIFQYKIKVNGVEIQNQDFKKNNCDYLAGKLVQSYSVNNLNITQQLIFATPTSALIKIELQNTSKEKTEVNQIISGEIFQEIAEIITSNNTIQLKMKAEDNFFEIRSEKNNLLQFSINQEKTSYTAVSENITVINELETKTFFYEIKFNSPDFHETNNVNVMDNPITFFEENKTLWENYLKSVLSVDNQWANDTAYMRIAVKTLLTLTNNHKIGYKNLITEGVFPSYAVDYFNGFWAWDSWKHAVALVLFNAELAKNQIRTMFHYQNSEGMVADCIYADSTLNNWLNTKPPLAAWAVWEVFAATNDTAFVAEMFPKLQKYHQWWYSYRDSDKNGLCEYGSSNGSLEAAKWESGMDNAIRFDNSKMVKINNSNWAFNQESVDLNSFLFAEKQYLAKMAVVLKNTTFYEQISSEAEVLAQQIREKMFDSETGYFYDIDLITKKIIPIQGPEGWIPLWAGIATAEEADKVVSVMLDTTKFATYIPFPTAPKDNPEFGDGYWRGPIWLDQVYFAVTALKNYGYETEADSCVKVVFDKLEGLKNSDLPIRENYRPLTGEGIRVNHFSWSAAHLLLLYHNK